MPSNQETFDYVVNFLRKQGKQSIGRCAFSKKLTCVYRSKNGTKCAVGCLIPDNQYNPAWEGWGVCGELQALMISLGYSIKLLIDLQTVHDKDIKFWEDGFRTTAARFKLVYTPPAQTIILGENILPPLTDGVSHASSSPATAS